MKVTPHNSFGSKFKRAFAKGLRQTTEVLLILLGILAFILSCIVSPLFLPFILWDVFSRNLTLRTLPPLLLQLGNKDRQKQLYAFEQLMAMSNEAIPLLLKALEALPDKSSKMLAVKGLAQLRAKEAVPHLTELLEDSEQPSEIRAMAAWALGEIGDESSIPALIDALIDEDIVVPDVHRVHSDPIDFFFTAKPVKHYAAEALKKFGLGDLVAAFLRVLEERDEKAIEKLKKFKSYRNAIVRTLCFALDFPPTVSSQAAWALGELKAVEAIPQLERKAESLFTPKVVRESCREALEKLRF